VDEFCSSGCLDEGCLDEGSLNKADEGVLGLFAEKALSRTSNTEIILEALGNS
jgi:hypothetical protein